MRMTISLHEVADAAAYWVFGWNIIYILLPPREMFKSERYNTFVALVGYYGSLNVRKLTTQAYGIVQDGNVAPPEAKP
jgi:hypothetical protein